MEKQDFISNLYSSLTEKGVTGIGDPISFRAHLTQDKNGPDKLYDAMQSRGYQLGDRNNFRKMIQPVPSKTAATQIQANTIAAMSARALENRRRQNAEQLSRTTKQLANYQNQPAFDTGNAEANKYLVKSQGQLDKQAQQLANKQNVQEFVAPKVAAAINTAEDAANESYYKQEQELQKMPDFGQGQGNTMRLAAMQKNNQISDPQRIIQSLQKEIGSYYQDPTVKAQIKQDANSLGISTKDYIDNYVQPKLQDTLSQQFDKQEVLKNMPKSTAEYIIQGATNGIAGMLMQGLVNTPSQQKYINEATAATEKGLNPDTKPNTAAKLGNFTVSVTADAPFFGLTGKTSSLLVKQIAKREVGNLVGKGFSRAAATRVIGAKLENSVGKRVASRIVEGTVSNAANMSAYNGLSETARQVRDSEFNPTEIGKQALNGAATGAALAVPGGIIGGAAAHLSGAKKLLASTAGFLTEAGTFATTGEAEKYLQGNSKDIHFGQDFLENAEQLLVMKATGGHLLQGVKNLFTPTHEGVSFTKDEINDIDQSAAAKNLFSSLSNMAPAKSQYPEGTFSNGNEDLQKNYANFMKDKDVTLPEKQKVALTFGGPIQTVIPPTASYKTIDNGDGTSTVTTRDTKGNAIFRKTFSRPDELNQYINRVNVDVNLNDLDSIKKDNPYAVAEGIVSLRSQNKYSKEEIDNVVNGNGNPDESLNRDILSDIYQETLPYAYPASEPHTEHDYQEGQKLQGTDRNQAIAEADEAEAALDYKPGNVESENFKNDVIAGREHPNAALADIFNNYNTEQGQLAIDYYNKYWKSKGVMDNAIDDVEQQVKTANKRVESNTHTSGQIIEASDGDKHYYVVAGKIAYDTEGNIDKNDTDKALVIRDTHTGELSSISPDRLTVVGTFDPQELKDRNETELRQQLIEQTDSDLSTQTSEQPVTSAEQTQAGENQPLAKKDVENSSQTLEQPQQEAEKQSKPESIETNSVFPKNARGEKLYTKTEPDQAFDELKNDTGSESGAMEIAQSSISDLADELKAHDRKKAKLMRGKTPAEKIEIQKQFAQEKIELENEKRSWEKILQVPIDRSTQKRREEIAAREQANKELERQKHDQLVTEEQNKELQDVKPFSREGNPSAEYDTEEAARARGFRNLDGKRIGRQDHTEGVYGNDASVTFSQNDVQVGDTKISGTQPTRYKVIDASQLQPSHTESGKNAAFFIDSAQPKQDSNDADREQALEKIAAHIDPKQVTGAGGAYQNSAPTVNKRGEVIQGNNRSRGLKLMYEGNYPESQQRYKNYLIQHADDFGLNGKDIQKMEHPVLVNEADVDDNTAIALGQKRASDLESGGETLIATKNAVTALMQVDSKTGGMKMRTFTGRLLETDNPDATLAELIAKNGAKALDYLYEQGIINDTERKNSLNDFGNINDNGKKAIMDIMKEYLFAGNKQLKTYFSTLRDAAQGAILKTFTRDFENPPGESLLPYLRESLDCLHAALSDDFFKSAEGNSERAQRAMEEFLDQGILFGEKKSEREKYSIFATELAWRLQGMGARGLTDMFNRLYDKIQGVKGNDMFDTSDGEPVSVEKAIQIVFGIEQKKIDKYGNDGQNERSDVAVSTGTSAERRQRSTESSGNSEQNTQTEGATNNTRGTASYSAEGARDTETKHEKAEQPRREQEIESGESQKPINTDKSPSDLFAEAGKAVQQEKNRRQTNADIAQAEHNTDENPTEAQKEAGNYKKGHVNIDGFDISIENPRGSIRRGTDKNGSKWETEMHNTYGYIRGTQGVDGDHIDVYLSDNPTKGDVFVIDQTNPDGSFDEHKVMYGFNSEQEAKRAYLSNYVKGWKGLGSITQVSKEEFKKWINSSHRKTKPFAEYTSVNKDTKVSDDKANRDIPVVSEDVTKDNERNPLKSVKGWYDTKTDDTKERYKLGDSKKTFDERLQAAVKNNGTVMDGLVNKKVKVVYIPRHTYTGTAVEAEKKAIDEAKKKYIGGEGNGPKILHYDNYGSQFDYTISGKSINKSMSHEATKKSKNQGVHIAVLNHLDEIIGSSIEAEEHPDYLKGEDGIRKAGNGNNSDFLIHRFFGAINIDGKVYRVKITMREPKSQNRNNREYTYEVTNVEVPNEESSSTSNGVDKSTSQKEVLSYPLAKLLKGVRKSYEENKNILDESENESRNNGFENLKSGEGQIISHIENLSSKLNTNVQIVRSKDVPKDKEGNPHKGVKGWYDTKTGDVFINLDECKGERDASETLLHEVVGHKGLRALMGEDGYKKYIRAFLTNAQEDIRADISNTAINKYKGNFYEAIDEYLATEAEKGTGKRGMWQQLTDSLRDFLYKMGFTKFAPSISIYDTKRIFWESKNNLNSKNPLDAAKQAAFMRKLHLEEFREPQFNEDGRYWSLEETDNRYKKDQEEKEETPERTILKKMYEDSVTSLSSRWYEAFVDSMQSVDKLQKAIMAAKGISTIKDSEDAYTSMLQLSSKSTSETEQFLEMNYRNMFTGDKDSVVKIMNAAGLKGKDGYEDFKYYLLTKSGLERNRDFAVRDWASKKDADGVAAAREQSIQNISDLFLKYSKNQKDAETKKAIYDLIENSVKCVLGYMPEDERMQVQSGLETNATEVFMGRMKTDEFLKGLEENLVTEAELFRRTYAVEKEIKTNELKLGRIGFDQYNHYLDNLVSKRFNFDPTKTDYSGLSSLFPNTEGKGTDYQKAIDTVMSLEEKVGNERINNMWNLIKGISNYTLQKQADCGIISERSKEHVSKMFNWYIPMRGFKETTADEVYDYITAKPSIFSPTLKTAKGRTTIAEDPLANIGNMACSAILQGNKNLAKQRLLRLSQNNPTSLLTSDWEWIQNMGTKENPDWQKVFPDIPVNASSKEVKEIFDAFKTKMKDLSAEGMAQPIKNELKLPYIQVNKQQIKEHVIEVSVGGEKKMLIVNGNPRAAQAMNGLTNADQQSSIAKRLKKVSQFLAANFTTRNPTFIASNLMRDVGFAENSIAVKENGKYLLKFQKNLALSSANLFSPKNSLFWKYKHGYLDMKQETDRLFDEFLKNGGETGFVQLRSVEQFEKDIKHMLNDAQGGVVRTTAKKALLYIPNIVEDYNRRAEGVSRFTTYMTSRQLGRSIQRSISDAKEVTVNFNRKGAGLATGGFIGGFAEFFRTNYLFFNAGMQSLQTQIDLAKNHPIKYASIILGANFALGLMIPLLNQFLISQLGPGKNNSNNPYADLPEYMRRNNICIYAGNGNFITIPLAIELRAIYGLGEMVAGHTYAKDSESIKPAAEDVISQLTQILPIDFMANRNDANGHWYNFLVPDYAKPIVQNIENTDWTGIPIQKETPYNKDYPEYTKAYKGTAGVFIATSKWLNDHSPANTPSGHGDAVVPGYINLSPGKFENVVTGYLGGMGQTAIDAGKTLSMIWSDDYRNVRNVPIAKALFKHSDERTQFMGTNEKYYNYFDEYKETERRISGYKKLVKDGSHPEYSGWEMKLENEPYYERYLIFKGNEKTIQADDKSIKEFPDGSPEQKMWQTQLNLDKQTLVEQLNQVKDKK